MPHRQKSCFIPYSHTSSAFYLKSDSDDSKKPSELQVRVHLSILCTEELVHHKRFLHFYSVVLFYLIKIGYLPHFELENENIPM